MLEVCSQHLEQQQMLEEEHQQEELLDPRLQLFHLDKQVNLNRYLETEQEVCLTFFIKNKETT